MKPVVFLSHSSANSAIILRLREFLNARTASTLSLFVSSDGQSIPFGRNWVHEIEQALRTADLMFLFLSPDALRSSWLPFEAGFGYALDRRVIPVGILGVDLSQVPTPFSLLQGFNLNSPIAAGNILAIINQQCSTSYSEHVESDEFCSIFGNSEAGVNYGKYYSMLEGMAVSIGRTKIDRCGHFLETQNREFVRLDERRILTAGLKIEEASGNIRIEIDPYSATHNMPLISRFLGTLGGDLSDRVAWEVDFIESIRGVQSADMIAGRLMTQGAKVLNSYEVLFKGMKIFVHQVPGQEYTGDLAKGLVMRLHIRTKDPLTDSILESTIDSLFDARVLQFS